MSQFESLFALRDLGYKGFKLITQNDHSQLTIDRFSVKELVKRRLRSHPALYRVGSRIAAAGSRLDPAGARRGGPHLEGSNGNGWQFPFGSSGPFGDAAAGTWRTFEDVAYTWLAYQLGESRYGQPSLNVWHDVHATTQ